MINNELKLGISLFNEGKYYQAHDVLEKLWRKTDNVCEEKLFYQGLIQSCVALYLLEENRYDGAYKVFLRCKNNFNKYQNNYLNINSQDLLTNIENAIITNKGLKNMKIKILLISLIFTFTSTFTFDSSVLAETGNDSLITVTGSGEVKSKPDVATISIGVLTKGKNANDAVSSNSISSQKLLDTLRSSGIVEKDIQTSSINVFPVYKTNDNENTIIGYQANNHIIATIRKISDVGRIIDSVSLTGNYTISGIDFGIDDTNSLQDAALEKAVTDARRKADTVAKAAGVSITGIKNINVDNYGLPFIKSSPVSADIGSSTQVLPGELSINASISIQYTINK